jgi:hypothetical protein
MPKTFVIDPANPQATHAATVSAFTDIQAVLASSMDGLPDEAKNFFTSLKATVDAALTRLASRPTDQAPAALDANYALRSLMDSFACMQELANTSVKRIEEMSRAYGLKIERVNELETKLDKKDLLTKEDAERAANDAVERALTKERNRIKLVGDRRTALCQANLPTPMEDAGLDGDEAAFTTLKTTITERHKKLGELGLIERLNAADLSELCAGSQKDFYRYLKLAEKARPPAPGTGEPLAGGGNVTGGAVKLTF